MFGKTRMFHGLSGLAGKCAKGRKPNAAQYRQFETDKKLSASTQVHGCWAFLSGSVFGWDLGGMANS
jgi:hypothetical protein